MSECFSAMVSDANWRADAGSWIRDRVSDSGATVIGEPEQIRVRPWSTHIRVDTDRGRLWFKANCAAIAFEAWLHATLAAIAPDIVETPWAVDQRRGWLLTSDHGEPPDRQPTIAHWQEMMTTIAALQRRAAPYCDALLATGLSDCSPHTVPARFDALLEAMAALPEHDPRRIDTAQSSALTGRRPQVVDAAAALSDSPVPISIQHGDLHPRNTAVAGERIRIFDFGDAQWASALEVLAVPRGWTKTEALLPWDAIRDAYLDCWLDLAGRRELTAAYQAISFTQPINRAWTWWRLLASSSDDERATWGAMPGKNLMRLLDA